MREYHDMCKVLHENEIGIAKLDIFQVGMNNFRAMIDGVVPGEYIRLYVNGELMMSDTNMEKRTSMEFMHKADGKVLICGLGIGLVIMPLLNDDKVESITVIEKYQDVINCVLPQIKPYDKSDKLKVVCADCFDFNTQDRFDTIFIDIWPYINSDIYNEEMKPLKRKYRKYLSERGKQNKNIFVWAEYQAKHDMRL